MCLALHALGHFVQTDGQRQLSWVFFFSQPFLWSGSTRYAPPPQTFVRDARKEENKHKYISFITAARRLGTTLINLWLTTQFYWVNRISCADPDAFPAILSVRSGQSYPSR